MRKTFLITIAFAALGGAIALVGADDMGNMGSMPGMNMGGMTQTNAMTETTNSDNAMMKCYAATGVVENIPADRTQATIHHQNIPGYMEEMTMDFPVKNTNELNGISPGDQITFNLVVGTNDEWIENIQRAGQAAPVMTNNMPPMNMPQSGK